MHHPHTHAMNVSSSSSSEMAIVVKQQTQRMGNLVADVLYGILCALIEDEATARTFADWILAVMLFGFTCYFGYQFVKQIGHIGMRAVYAAISLLFLAISMLLAYTMFTRAWGGGNTINNSSSSALPPPPPPQPVERELSDSWTTTWFPFARRFVGV